MEGFNMFSWHASIRLSQIIYNILWGFDAWQVYSFHDFANYRPVMRNVKDVKIIILPHLKAVLLAFLRLKRNFNYLFLFTKTYSFCSSLTARGSCECLNGNKTKMHLACVNQEKTPKRNYSEDDMTKKSAADGILPKTQTAVMNILNFRIFLLMNLTFWYYASQHTVKPLLSPQGLIYFKHVWAVVGGGGGPNRDQGLIWEGGLI